MSEITLEDVLLKSKLASAKDEYKTVLQLQENALIQKWGTTSNSAIGALDAISKASVYFAAVYDGVKSKAMEEKIFNSLVPDDFKKAYFMYCGSEAVIQALNPNTAGSRQRTHESEGIAPEIKLNFGARDYNVINSILESLGKYISNAPACEDLNNFVVQYFKFMEVIALEKLLGPGTYSYQDTVKSLRVTGKGFDINGLKKFKPKESETKMDKQESEDELFQRDPKIITLDKRLKKTDILGNDTAVNEMEIAIAQLMAYDSVKKMNPYLMDGGFKQLIMLVGDRGTGKTMIMKYGVSEAERIAKANGLEFMAVELDFDDSWQDGPSKILKYQLKSITNSNKPYLIFLDEIDGKFPSRIDPKTARHEQKTLTEFLNFTQGLSYQNKGNYIIVAATNVPEQIDKAILSRFTKGIYNCEGPRTAKDKAKVLYNNLSEGINAGYVKIRDEEWVNIGELAVKLELSGRGLLQVAEEIIGQSRTNHYPDNFYKMSFDEKVKMIKSRHELVDYAKVKGKLETIASKKGELDEAAKSYHLN